MTITDLGSIGEFVSAIAILVTLIYLTIQVRHTQRETAASLLQQRTVAVREMYLAIATSETLSDAMSKAEDAVADGPTGFDATLIEQGGLTRREAYQVSRWYRAMNRVWAGQHQVVTDRWERDPVHSDSLPTSNPPDSVTYCNKGSQRCTCAGPRHFSPAKVIP
jgi:hypothetical protein